MKIYFTASTADFATYREHYFAIRDFLVAEGHILTRDWLPPTDEKIKSETMSKRDIKYIYKKCLTAIHEADLVIVEDTVSNFSTGHHITLALQQKIPVLVLWNKQKHNHFTNMFIHGVESDLLETAEYKGKDVEGIIKGFIKKYAYANEKQRFHLVVNQAERRYLDWAQFHKGKSRTALIRQAIDRMMDEDEGYGDYVRS